MSDSENQPELILDLDPVIYNASNSPATSAHDSASKQLPQDPEPNEISEKDDILSTGQSTTKFIDSPIKSTGPTSSSRANSVKIKDLLEGYASSTRRSTELSSQYRTLDQRVNTSIEYSDTNPDESVDLSRSFHRANSANTLGYRNRLNNSAFMAAYQADARDKPIGNDLRKKNSNIRVFTPLNRSSQRPLSSQGYRQNAQIKPSLSPGRDKSADFDMSMISRDCSMRMETAPEGEYESVDASMVIADRKEAVRHYKQQGVQKYENKVLRQELERQMKMMENRVKRLSCEDQTIKRNIRKTGEVMNKALITKQRFQDDLLQSQTTKLKKLQEEQKARERIREERLKRDNSIKSKLAVLQKEKALNASQVKFSLQQDGAKLNEELKKEEEKRQKIYRNTADFEKMLKMKKKAKQIQTKEQTDENHLRFLQEEHMRTMEIERRIQELARKEERLIDQIKATHQIQVRAEGIMKKVLTTKVERVKQIEL